MSVSLCQVTAKCPVEGCNVVKGQIDPSSEREHAIRVVTDAMNAHIDAEHPELSGAVAVTQKGKTQ